MEVRQFIKRFGLSHILYCVRQRLNSSLTITTLTSDTGAPVLPWFSLFLALAIWKIHKVMVCRAQRFQNHPDITTFQVSNETCNAEKQMKADRELINYAKPQPQDMFSLV